MKPSSVALTLRWVLVAATIDLSSCSTWPPILHFGWHPPAHPPPPESIEGLASGPAHAPPAAAATVAAPVAVAPAAAASASPTPVTAMPAVVAPTPSAVPAPATLPAPSHEPVPTLVKKYRVSPGAPTLAIDKGLWPARPSTPVEHPPPAATMVESLLPVAEKAALDPNDEATLIAALDKLGYLYYNSFDRDPDGSATIRAILRTTGELRTLHVGATGTIGVESGWKQ